MTYTEAYRHFVAALRENPKTPPPALRMETTGEFHAWKSEMRAFDAARIELKLATPEEIQAENSVVGRTPDRGESSRMRATLERQPADYLHELHIECRAGRVPESRFVAAVNYTGEVVISGYAGNATHGRGLDLTRVIPTSIWLTGPASLQPILGRLQKQGIGP